MNRPDANTGLKYAGTAVLDELLPNKVHAVAVERLKPNVPEVVIGEPVEVNSGLRLPIETEVTVPPREGNVLVMVRPAIDMPVPAVSVVE